MGRPKTTSAPAFLKNRTTPAFQMIQGYVVHIQPALFQTFLGISQGTVGIKSAFNRLFIRQNGHQMSAAGESFR
jgi:hypothetical protein